MSFFMSFQIEYFGFVNAVKWNKMFEDLTLSSGAMWEYFWQLLQSSTRRKHMQKLHVQRQSWILSGHYYLEG